jgi:hypothetical protein
MAQTGPISRAHDPGFNIMGFLLGGRGYAANYFAQQDAQQRQQVQQQQRGEYAQGILNSPAFGQAVTDPGLQKQYGLWAKFAGGDDQTAGLGNSLLDKAVGNYYTTGQQSNEDKLTRGRMTFNDQLERSRIAYGSDVQLKADQIKRDRDMAQVQKMGDYLGGEGAQSQIMRNYAAKQLGVDVPTGYDVVPMGTGGIGFRPAPGSEAWGKMTSEVGAMNNIVGGYGDLMAMAKNGTGSQGAWEATKASMVNDMRKAFDTGSLDQGSLDFFDKLIPNRWDDLKANPTQWGIVQEKLKTGLNLMQGRRDAVGDKWMIDPNKVPNRYSGALPVPGKDIPNPPTDSPLAARKAMETQRDAAPVSGREGRYDPAYKQQGESVWDTPASGSGRGKGERFGRYGGNR